MNSLFFDLKLYLVQDDIFNFLQFTLKYFKMFSCFFACAINLFLMFEGTVSICNEELDRGCGTIIFSFLYTNSFTTSFTLVIDHFTFLKIPLGVAKQSCKVQDRNFRHKYQYFETLTQVE